VPMWRNSHSKGWYAWRNIEWQIMRSTMKAIIFGAILGFGSIAPSLAADLPARPYSAPASYVPIGYDWTSLYVGANADRLGAGSPGRLG
jgi:hypothetical protein